MTIEEAVQTITQEIKDHIDIQKADMLSKMNNKFELVKNFLHNKIQAGQIIIEKSDKNIKSNIKRYQN